MDDQDTLTDAEFWEDMADEWRDLAGRWQRLAQYLLFFAAFQCAAVWWLLLTWRPA
jgi:hypothetical protein